MNRFCGTVGFLLTREADPINHPGVWPESITEQVYRGDVQRNSRRWEQTSNMNDNVVINNSVSIVADDFALQNIGAMKYVKWMGTKWKITNVEIQRPRLILTIGGIYNGPSD